MKPAAQEPHALLGGLLRAVQPQLWRASQFGAVSSLMMLVPSLYMLEVYDRVVNSRSVTTLLMLTLALLLALALMELLDWVRNQLLFAAGLEADAQVAPKLARVMLHSNARRLPGGTLQPLQDWKTLRDFLGSAVLPAVMELPASLVFLVIVFALHPLLGWATLLGGVAQLVITVLTEKGTQDTLKQASRQAAAAQQFFEATVRNAEVMAAMGMLPGFRERWAGKQREFLSLQSEASRTAAVYQALSRWLQLVLGSALLGLGAWLTLRNQLVGGAGMMIVASIIGGRVLSPMVVLITQWKALAAARLSWQRLNAVLAADPDRAPTMSLPAPKGRLTVEQAFVSPPVAPGEATLPPVLRGLQFEVLPGELLVVTGPSASGKTTLARALVGLWPTTAGKVRLDGADVHAWNKAELGPYVGYMPHGIELFEGSFADNIARFGTVDHDALVRAATEAGMDAFIRAQPQGYDTAIGEEGRRLSGGQRQKLGLARALYGPVRLLVLDEPNSNLDLAGEQDLLKALAAAKARGCTVVVMTHRRGVLDAADKLLILRDGVQQAFGPREEVLAALQQAAAKAKA